MPAQRWPRGCRGRGSSELEAELKSLLEEREKVTAAIDELERAGVDYAVVDVLVRQGDGKWVRIRTFEGGGFEIVGPFAAEFEFE